MKQSESEVKEKSYSTDITKRLLKNLKDKGLACDTTGIPIDYKCQENHPPKKLFLEYHPPLPHYVPAKTCLSGHHGNGGSCYLCHHGNLLPPANGCISYAPIPVSPRFNGVCFCLVCQQRAAALSCNCQQCLSLRFEHTAASVLRPHDKELSIKSPPCCNIVACKSIPTIRPHYPRLCHCLDCVSNFAKDSRLHSDVHNVVNRQDIEKTETNQEIEKDPNNNESQIETNEKSDCNADENEPTSDRDMSPRCNKRTDNSQDTTCSEPQNKKRKHDHDEILFTSKVIKTEIIEDRTCTFNNDEEHIKVSEKDRNNKEKYNSDSCEEQEKETQKEMNLPSEHFDSFEDCEEYYRNGFDLKDDRKLIKANHKSESQKGRKHYNTRFTSTKTHSDKDYGSPKLKKDRDNYCDVKNISRQRTKLNRLLANEHERRRVAQLNSAYQSLRQLIPGYQCDTKLPKIKILRYAINYIAHLDNILETDAV